MDTFEKNFWSLYLDFLNDFEELSYSGFSIPYLCEFGTLVRNIKVLWKNNLYDEKFTQRIKNQVKDKNEIQDMFNKFILSHKKKPLVKNKYGKIVFHDDRSLLLRIPDKTFIDHFERSKILIIDEGINNYNKSKLEKKKKRVRVLTNTHVISVKNKKKRIDTNVNEVNIIPTDHFQNYAINTKEIVTRLQNNAIKIINMYKEHPLYKDNQFQSALLSQISRIVNRIEESKNLIDKISISCIVLPYTNFIESRTLALVAAEKGVPTICMQHGIIGSQLGYIPKIADVDAVYGYFEKDWYKKMGIPEESLEIIGHPRFDQAFARPKLARNEFNKQFGLDNTKKTIMIVTRANTMINKWRILIKKISMELSINVVIRDFPSMEQHKLSKEFPFVYSPQMQNLYDIIPHVDCVVSYPSTVGLEAMLADKAVFILNEELEPGDTGYYSGLDKMVQEDPEILGEIIIKYFNDSDWEFYANRTRDNFLSYAYPDFNMSGERLNKLINRLTN
ncbi:glycosyltransferase family protein [Oceanobacillus profundus]|uniref:hypothetical protein n=1 Tax=Oceanobacillus profundus TaxID=372463 RepID=UPI00362B253D